TAEDDHTQCQVIDFPLAGSQCLLLGLDQLLKCRRCLVQNCDLLPAQQLIELIRCATYQVRHDHQTSAVEQCSPDLPHREIKGIGVKHRPHIRCAEAEPIFCSGEQPHHVAV